MKYNKIYPTIIGEYTVNNCDDLNHGLTELIYNMRSNDQRKNINQYSMSGPNGYHTDNTILKHDNVYVKIFHEIISKEIVDYFSKITGKLIKNVKLTSWAMIYGKGAHAKMHVHPKADLTTIYYVKVPSNLPSNDGALEILDPRPAARWDINYNDTFYNVKSVEGQGIIFPGWLEHQVTPHYIVDEDRISISTNIMIDYDEDII